MTLSHAANTWKSLNHEISYKKKILDQRNTHGDKNQTHEIHTRKISDTWNTHKKEYLGPTKYPRWHDGTRLTRPRMARHPQNLAHSHKTMLNCEGFISVFY